MSAATLDTAGGRRLIPGLGTPHPLGGLLPALYRYFHPIRGGPEGRGWPFGRPIHTGEVYAVLQRLTGTEFVEDVKLFAADPVTGERGGAVQRIDVGAHALVFSYEHQVRVDPS